MDIARQIRFFWACLWAFGLWAVASVGFLVWLYLRVGYVREMAELVGWFTKLSI